MKKENGKMEDSALDILIESSGNDIRQMINELQLHGKVGNSMSLAESKKLYFHCRLTILGYLQMLKISKQCSILLKQPQRC